MTAASLALRLRCIVSTPVSSGETELLLAALDLNLQFDRVLPFASPQHPLK
jgi:hypothetical protein